MTAFVVFVRTYAVWMYLLCVIGMIIGAKWLVDARRLSRTTLFSLEQERANEQSYRAVILIVVALVAIGAIAFVNLLIAPLAPQAESPVARVPTGTLAPLVFPSSTLAPTPTATILFKPTDPPAGGTAPPAATPTRTAPRPTIPAALPPTATPAYAMPAPVITGPLPNGGTWIGEGQANAAITFRWNCEQCALGSNDWYEVAITYIDKHVGGSRTVAGRTQNNFLPLKRIYEGGGFELYQKAKEDNYTWIVQVKREPGNQPLSPPSATWKFVWK